jgi:hypothetical protein
MTKLDKCDDMVVPLHSVAQREKKRPEFKKL